MLEVPIGVYRHRQSLVSMGSLALSRLRGGPPRSLDHTVVSGEIPPYNRALAAEFRRVTQGIDDGFVPPTFYVTWAMAALADAIVKARLPYDFSRVLHSASEFTYARRLSPEDRARYEVRVASVDDNERRAKIRVEGVVPGIFTQAMELHVPKKRSSGAGKREPAPPLEGATLATFHLPRVLGREYALVSGDFNPVHWSATAAKALGFKTQFLQGYCGKALIAHALMRKHGSLKSLRVEFKKPVFLPADVSLIVNGRDLALVGAETHVTGTFDP